MTETLYFADLAHNGTIRNIDTFPLGSGFVAGYTKQQFGNEVDCELFKFPQELNDALKSKMPRVVAFANYCWNLNITMEFANYIKKVSPQTITIMGGPNIPSVRHERMSFLTKYSSIDFYIKWDGEHAFANLYEQLMKFDFDVEKLKKEQLGLFNCLYLAEEEFIEGEDLRIQDLMSIPSPYLMGFLDKFFEQGLRPVIETTRGCPYKCTYCNDAVVVRDKVYRKTIGYIQEELEYIASHIIHPTDLLLADLNFGMYKEDLETAKIIRGIIDKYNWPKTIDGALGKSHPERVWEAIRTVNGRDKTVWKMQASYQSTDPDILAAIKRRNLPVEKISEMTGQMSFENDNAGFFTEFILGLPLDSKKKHFKSLSDAVDNMAVDSLDVHQLNLAMGAPMADPEQRERWGFNSRYRVFIGRIGKYFIGEEEKAVAESDEVVVGNKSMSFDDWIECRVVHLFVKVYLDRGYFNEVFQVIKHLGLGKFDLLLHLCQRFLRKYENLEGLVELFIRKVKEPLFDTMEEFMEFTTKPETVDKFAAGILGGNELTIHRAKAYLECNDDLHQTLQDATLSYLKQNDLKDDITFEYVRQAIQFSKLRKFSFEDYETNLEEPFNFDFTEAIERNFSVTPEEIYLGKNRKRYMFFYEESAKEEIKYAVALWLGLRSKMQELEKVDGQSEWATEKAQRDYNLGKFFHQVNMKVLRRSVREVSWYLAPNY